MNSETDGAVDPQHKQESEGQGFNEVCLRPSTKKKYTVLFVFVPEGHDTNFLRKTKLIIQLQMTNQATKFHRVSLP